MKDSAMKYRQDFELDYNATAEQREMCNEELRFSLVSGGQWEGYLEDEYENRAKMEVDQTSEYLHRTFADWTQNRMGVNYSPDDEATTDEDAKLLDGLFRRDMRRRGGQDAVDTAVYEAIGGGYGALILNSDYEDALDSTNQKQNITITECPNAYALAVFDSGARRKDKSDARRCTILTPYTKEVFDEKWPGVESSSLRPHDKSYFNWSNDDHVYVGTRYEIKEKTLLQANYLNVQTKERVTLESKKEIQEEELSLLAAGFIYVNKRTVKHRQVFKTLFTGDEILEKERRIAGNFIPVIPFYGFRGFVDGVEYFHGVIRKRMDAQRLLNMSISLAAEGAAHSHEGKQIFTPEQVSGLKGAWSKNLHQAPYALADPVYNEDGSIQHLGPVGQIAGSTLAPAAASLIQMTSDFIRMGTGGAPQDISDPNASGKAINALIKRSDKNTQPIFDNIRTSLKHLGRVYQSMASEIYAGKENFNRALKIVNEKEETSEVRLLSPLPNGAQVTYQNDVSKGSFEVVVDIGRDYSTQREESIEALKDILISMPQDHPMYNDTLGEIIYLLPNNGLNNLQRKVRYEQLIGGAAPDNDEERALVENIQSLQGAEKPKTPNDMLLESAALEQQTQAAMNQQKIEGMKFENLKKLEESKKVQAQTAMIQAELKELIANGQANTLEAS